MKLSWSATWNEAARLLQANASLFFAITGVFFFLPAVLVGWLIPPPEEGATLGELLTHFFLYMEQNWFWLLMSNLINMLGSLTIFILIFDRGGRTVGAAIGSALRFLIFYFLLQFLTGAAIGLGLMLLILPGLYLIGRLVTSGPAMVAEQERNPLAAITSSWRLTRGNGWRVAGFIILIAIAGSIMIWAVEAVLGSIFLLLFDREGVGGLLTAILAAALGAVFSLVLTVVYAALYRSLARKEESTIGT